MTRDTKHPKRSYGPEIEAAFEYLLTQQVNQDATSLLEKYHCTAGLQLSGLDSTKQESMLLGHRHSSVVRLRSPSCRPRFEPQAHHLCCYNF